MSLRDAYATLTRDEADERDEFLNPRAYVEFKTKDMKTWGVCGDYRDLKFTDQKNKAGSLSITLPDDEHWRAYFDGQPKRTVRPIVIRLPGYTTLWFITSFTRTRKGLSRYYEVGAVGALEHLNWLRIWPCPWFPPEFQPIKFWFGLGPASSVMAGAYAANLVRVQGSLWSIPTGNLLNLQSWNILKTALHPIIINPRNKIIKDTSPWIASSWRMDKAMDAFTEVCDAENMQMTATFFDPDVDPQPFPEFAVLTEPKLIIDFVEKGAPVGWTGTLIDGFFRTGLAMADDFMQWILYPILGEEQYDDYLQKAAGAIADKPIAIYTTGDYSPVDEFEQTTHVGLATRITAGGKSPDWLNNSIVTGLNLLLGGLGSMFGLPGLSLGIFDGLVKDTIMAFHSQEDLRAANEAGPWRFREDFGESSATGLTLNIFAGMKSQHFKNRAYVSHAITASNGAPYFIGKDLELGDLIGVELADGTVEVDYLEEITYEDSRSVRGRYTLQIGRPDAEREPGSIALSKIRGLGTWITRLALSE
ncbi:hypothetical protein L5I01_17525 [Gordonia sp. HY442]|uniref:Gp37-like protein n=1 Tax=Gordonia zhenghanii TaxID=2911516 RepID=UPI001F48728E|nr:hypothetical protein [Gordonia zhenghanii]MCF8605158.1 hypothetical protein [Gordonia zhenghanii]